MCCSRQAEGTDIELRDGNIEKLERDEGSVIGLRVFVGKSSAMTSGNVMTRDAACAGLPKTPLPWQGSPSGYPSPVSRQPDCWRQSFPELDLASDRCAGRGSDCTPWRGRSRKLPSQLPASPLRRGFSFSLNRSVSPWSPATALRKNYERTGISISVSAIAGEGTGMERDYDYSSAIHLEDLRSPSRVGATRWRASRAPAQSPQGRLLPGSRHL